MVFNYQRYFFYPLCLILFGLTACDDKRPAKEPSASQTLDIDTTTVSMTSVRKIPLEDFFKNPERVAYQLSPNGAYLAYLAPYQNRKNIFVEKIGSNEKATRVTSVTDRDLSSFFWANNERLVYTRDFGGDENYHLFSTDLTGQEEKDLTPYDSVRVLIIDPLLEDEEHMLIGTNKRIAQIFDPYRININTGELQQVAENRGDITEWITDHEGKLRAAIATNGVSTTTLYRASEQDTFEAVATYDFKVSVSPMYFDFDNSETVYALSNKGRDKAAVIKMNIRTGEELELIYEHPQVDVSYMSYSRKRKVPTTVSYITWKKEKAFVDEQAKSYYQDLEKQLGTDYEINIASASKDEDKFIIRTYSDRSMGAYYLYDVSTKALEKLADVSPWLKAEELAPMKAIQYSSRDSLTIHGYLTLPLGVEAKNLPVVVNPHGGPWARDAWTFNPEVQFLCNRGYAVLQMNFRGSTGYGRKFWQASFKEWGLKMQDDVTDGVNWLIEQGIADSNRIAIYGGSYGGYCTLAGITFTPELYACAIDYVGVSNLFTFMESIPPYWEPYRQMLYEMVGNPSDEADSIRMRATSPVFHVEKIETPLLIAQGARDPRVNQAESDQMVEALRNKKVNVEYILKENEGHGFRNEENRFEFYQKMDDFLSKHLQAKDMEG